MPFYDHLLQFYYTVYNISAFVMPFGDLITMFVVPFSNFDTSIQMLQVCCHLWVSHCCQYSYSHDDNIAWHV